MSKLTKVRRALALAMAAILGGLAAVTFSAPAVSQAATNTVYSLTVAGTEAHSLSPYHAPAFTNSGGVVPVHSDATHDNAANRYFESAFDLPTGAKITSLSVAFSGCSFAGKYTFGSYSLTGSTTQLFTLSPPNNTCARTLITKTGAPITTVAAGRRYVLDWTFFEILEPGYSDTTATQVNTYYGATVKYTCTAPCVP